MDVYIGGARTDSRNNVDVVVTIKLGMNSTLQADFSGALFSGYLDSLGDLVES